MLEVSRVSDLSSSNKRVRASRILELAKGVDAVTASQMIEFALNLEQEAAVEERRLSAGRMPNHAPTNKQP